MNELEKHEINESEKTLPDKPNFNDNTENQKSNDSILKGEVEIKTIDEYIKIIDFYKNEGFSFYRGDKFCKIDNIELIPKVYKDGYSNLCSTHDEAIKEFAELTASKIPIPSSGFFEDMINAQHYELPTRLLDWTESALIALYFAVFPKVELNWDDKYNSIVWLLNPIRLNSHTETHGEVSIDINSTPKIMSYYKAEATANSDKYPIAVKTRKINPRIDAQQGAFVLFCKNDRQKSLHLYHHSNTFLKKIIIRNEYASNIYKSLVALGITQYSIFPEPQSISIDIIVRRNKVVGGK